MAELYKAPTYGTSTQIKGLAELASPKQTILGISSVRRRRFHSRSVKKQFSFAIRRCAAKGTECAARHTVPDPAGNELAMQRRNSVLQYELNQRL
jgi:hypothetical protein